MKSNELTTILAFVFQLGKEFEAKPTPDKSHQIKFLEDEVKALRIQLHAQKILNTAKFTDRGCEVESGQDREDSYARDYNT